MDNSDVRMMAFQYRDVAQSLSNGRLLPNAGRWLFRECMFVIAFVYGIIRLLVPKNEMMFT
ncbi:hypothetical protein J1TS3_03940 [Siminovitchia fordii]|uniref:Uncharacterized protein n=1 Tax=Siminovitchia fordii TaxID=254759 RepID=A0ABQ4K285_9BACI|nr:hypothetical protein J1TS3_03940 [Siminovitchia fordii]